MREGAGRLKKERGRKSSPGRPLEVSVGWQLAGGRGDKELAGDPLSRPGPFPLAGRPRKLPAKRTGGHSGPGG